MLAFFLLRRRRHRRQICYYASGTCKNRLIDAEHLKPQTTVSAFGFIFFCRIHKEWRAVVSYYDV